MISSSQTRATLIRGDKAELKRERDRKMQDLGASIF